LRNYSVLLLTLCLGLGCSGTKKIILEKEHLRPINRKIVHSNSSNSVHLNAQKGEGLAIIEHIDFTAGTIEVDLQGEDVQGRSFIGIAFNIQNDSTYEVIYFRPFNFNQKEKARREHGIQYVFHPKFPWKTLRTEHKGVYEAEFTNPPAPDDWFTIRIAINSKEITVINPNTGASLLKVNRLSESKSKKIGLWTGFNSKGGFRNLKMIK